MEHSLTPRQRDVLAVIRRAVAANGQEPTLTAIGVALGGLAPPTVFKHVEALVAKGFLRRRPRARPPFALVVPPPIGDAAPPSVAVPIIGMLAPGEPVALASSDDGHVPVGPDLLPDVDGAVALRVRGGALAGEGLLDGDLLIVRRQPDAAPGATIVALLDGFGATVRRYQPAGDVVRLDSQQPHGEPMALRHVEIYGVVLGLIRRYGGAAPDSLA